MGRLEVNIRHGHDGGPGQWAAVIALIAFVVLAAAGGVGRHALTSTARSVLTAVEITAWVVGGLVTAAVVAGVVVIVVRVRAAVRAARARRAALNRPVCMHGMPSPCGTCGEFGPAWARVITLPSGRYRAVPDAGRPALDAPRRRFGDIAPAHRPGFGDITSPADDRRRS